MTTSVGWKFNQRGWVSPIRVQTLPRVRARGEKQSHGLPSGTSMAVIETMAEEVDDTDWTDELSAATERVMVVADALREDCDLMRGGRRLLTDMDGMPSGLSRRIFEAVAACLLGEVAEQHRKTRPGRGPKAR